MIFEETPLPGAFVIRPERLEDERGFFARVFCEREFAERGIPMRVVQGNLSWSRLRGTLRGLHYQRSPFQEAKLIRCTRGSVWDAIIDLRAGSPAFLRHFTVVLDAAERTHLYVPEGFAHGFLTLEDETEVSYQMSQFYSAAHAAGVRWDDPAFGIPWPFDPRVIAERDRNYPDFRPQRRAGP
jgi:dTDP-4-dehydrorhamnose 3,5-epimerase